jgi:hypothetical protein
MYVYVYVYARLYNYILILLLRVEHLLLWILVLLERKLSYCNIMYVIITIMVSVV